MRGCCGPALRFIVISIVAGLMAGCAIQPRDEVRVGIGAGFSQPDRAKHYAALYLPYAMMATSAYTDERLSNPNGCPDPRLLVVHGNSKDEKDYAFHRTVAGWVAYLQANRWECRLGRFGSLPCPPRMRDCRPLGGLEYHVWRRMDGGCREVVIAFRGSDRGDVGDWRSNFRWLHRLRPQFDQYAQIEAHMGDIVRTMSAGGCAGASTMFASVGHSLGGGLAQQAAYSNSRIRYVYAFDPSPVTGFFDLSAAVREANTVGLGIDRVYEQGEILGLPRRIIMAFYPPAPCNPRVRQVRFNVLMGTPVEQHSMDGLTANFRQLAAEKGASRAHADAHRDARHCEEAPSRI